MKTLHFDCFAGISGDMTLGALVDLGVSPDALCAELAKLRVDGWSLAFEQDQRNGITGTRAVVKLRDDGHHDHPHEHHHEEHEHRHAHNSWKEIRALIADSGITAGAKKRALDIFSRIAAAEAQVHGVPVDQVAFHEVGALDSIIDIVGTAVCLDVLAPDRITAGAIELGGGTVHCAHGELPVPAPATLLLCQGLPVKTGGFNKEMTTPTGAAILAASVDQFVTAGSFRELKTGYGIGTRKLDKPNVLRVSWREQDAAAQSAPWLTRRLTMIEANIDDMTGEALGFLMERLFAAGALDVTFTPCTMKKSRPGHIAGVLAEADTLDAVRRALFSYSNTIGFRENGVDRLELRREETVTAEGARQKTVFWGDKPLRTKVEYEDRAKTARAEELPLASA
jgi:uncharacterized protein (TIGR00299 family) protein